MKVLAVIDHYLPAFRMGGPIRSLSGLVDSLDEVEFYIVTSSTDHGSNRKIAGITCDTWTKVGGARVYYSSRPIYTLSAIRHVIKEIAPDLLYLNSLMSRSSISIMLARALGVIPKVPTLIAPRGELSAGALALKRWKKRLFLSTICTLRLYRDVGWHASSAYEAADIRRIFGMAARVWIAPNLLPKTTSHHDERVKCSGSARFIYLARITPKKNLHMAINLLRHMEGDITFHVYGPIEDDSYWRTCQSAARTLPGNVKFDYMGEVQHNLVPDTLSRYHFLLFPTLSENFGHTIAEALQYGCPVIISDQTPWRELRQAGVGWALSVEDHRDWLDVLNECVSMDEKGYRMMSRSCRGFAEKWVSEQGGRNANLLMFRDVVSLRQRVV